ncbi:hypothetical protein F8G81_07255 [Arthrobacter sp. CDRTa11]|uniref:hypothetical protein n=1 Tax=Arthrobacter sp. CDRTa11 TaxID=2651199 RepID=UPI0022658D8F|nr:hypothetical protein [Arthrobacter sp. CDRTa11]UZX02438.1 hypothetical protein F8G81_07255 [Arthrobacter sp. CDRTa11]
MAAGSYAPGTWLGIVRSGTAVILGPDTQPALVQSVWELLADGPEAHEVLYAVTSSFGVSLSQIPSFGIVDLQNSLHVFLRGELDLTAQLPGGPIEVSGRDVTTWNERRFGAPEWYRLTLPGAGPAARELPLAEGVVLMQSLTVALADAPTTAAPRQGVDAQDGLAATAVTSLASPLPVQPVPVLPAPVLAEPVLAEPVSPEPVSPEPVLAEPATPEMRTAAEPDTVLEGLQPAADGEAIAEPTALLPEEGATVPDSMAPEHGASAETVMGVLDDDAYYSAESAESSEPGEYPASAGEEPATGPDPVPANELTGTYDHLWERTVVRSIEDAAVRDDPEATEGVGPASPPGKVGSADLELPAQMPTAEAAAPEVSAPEASMPGVSAPPTDSGPISNGPMTGGLIDSVPWRTGGANTRHVEAPPALNIPSGGPGPEMAPGSGQDSPAEDPAGLPAGFDGDHDGHTIMKSDLAGMAAHPAPTVLPDAAGPLVLARVCSRGHANPPTHAQCAACGLPLPSDGVQVSRPRLGRMRVSTGEVVDLDHSLVIGRQPSVSRVQGGVMPRLVQVASPGGDISRSHVEVRLEGWHVMLCDLKATNGTVLVREGQQPRRLAQNEMAIVLDGDIAELGDNISLRFEEIL